MTALGIVTLPRTDMQPLSCSLPCQEDESTRHSFSASILAFRRVVCCGRAESEIDSVFGKKHDLDLLKLVRHQPVNQPSKAMNPQPKNPIPQALNT